MKSRWSIGLPVENQIITTLGGFTCLFGIHQWRYDYDTFIGVIQQHEVNLIWWTCEKCGKTKLKFIGR